MDAYDLDFWLRLTTAAVCGAAVGLERQLRGKPAGMRTSMLVCIGTFVFVGLGASVHADTADPTRVLGQVVTGIGFLGAGLILNQRGQVTGMTSAAVIWVLAAIGAVVALSPIHTAFVLAVVTIGVLSGVALLERGFSRLRRGAHVDDPREGGL